MLGPLMIDIGGAELSAEDRDLLRHPLIGGVLLFARNYVDPAQVSALTAALRALRDPPLVIGVDQEGGRVQRFRHGFTLLPPLGTIGDVYTRDQRAGLALAADCAWLMARELRAVGVDFSFAPVLDLRTRVSSVIGDRAFHAKPQAVARLAQAYCASLRECGVAGIGKHFPGHGSVAADSHHELPIDRRDYADLEQHDLLPFRVLIAAGIEALMTAHVLFPRVDDEVVGYSRQWIGEILRVTLGFDGAIFSDDLSMAAADGVGGYAVRAARALAAGCDVLLICNNRAGAIEVLDSLRGESFPRTQVRLMRMHARGSSPGMAEVRGLARWRETVVRVADLAEAPELDLGDRDDLA
jgi:beta-N-acetylhexosaminidase